MKKVFSLISALLILAVCLTSCDGLFSSGNEGTALPGGQETPAVQMTASPVISPASGDYSDGYKTISITCGTDGADIFYTTDGTAPTAESPRYTGPFTIIGTKTVKAVAIKGTTSSAAITAVYNLNAGKSQSQLGVVKGTINLSENLTDEAKAELDGATVYVFSDDLPGVVKTCRVGEDYYFDGLDTSKSYRFYFSNEKPTVVQGKAVSLGVQTVVGRNGVSVVAGIIDIQPAEGTGITADVDLEATGIIKGTAKRFDVTGAEERDHGGTVVYIPGTSYSAYTDAAGNFSMSGVPQGLHTIRAQYAGYTFKEKENVRLQATSSAVPETTIEGSLDIYFSKGIVKGSAVLSDATDSSSFSGISVVMSDDTNKYTYTANTSSSGSWAVTDVYPGTYTAEISKEGYESAIITGITVQGAAVTTVPVTSLQVIGGSLSGSVSISGKADLSGISILAKNSAGKSFYAVTDSNGEFAWEKVSPGTYTVSASYPGYKTVSIEGVVINVGGTVENLTLPVMEKATYSITGKVFLEGMISGFEGTSVSASLSSTLTPVSSAVTGIDGTFSMSDLEPGDYVLVITRTGYLTDNSVSVSVGTSPVSTAPDVRLRNAVGSVNGTASMESAADNAGIAILVMSETDATIKYSTVTDSTGRYSVGGVAPGSYKVQATKSGYNNAYSDSFTVSAGGVENVSAISLSVSQRSLYGTVTLEGRSDHAGVKITATNVNMPTEIYSALSNSTGNYALSGMTPGEYIVSLSAEGYVSQTTASISLANDSSSQVPAVELNKARGKISGIVNLEGCTDHSGITVSLVGTEYTYTTESDGSYEFSVPSGNYPGGLRFSREDYQLTAKAETIPVLTDSTYAVLTEVMKAVANTIKGTIDFKDKRTDSSGILVSIDEYPGVEKCTTDENGVWVLSHVPVDVEKTVTVRFSRQNALDVTTQIKVYPSDYIDIGTLEMKPNAANISGHAYLTGMSDHQDIVVTVKTDGKDDLKVKTRSDGTFVVTNVVSDVAHVIVFSKEGWESQEITVTDLYPLEERELQNDITLIDVTAPILERINIANYTNNGQLLVRLSCTEKGSGLEKMSLQVKGPESETLYPVDKNWVDYVEFFYENLQELPASVYKGTGEYEFHIAVKDKAGNISTVETESIEYTEKLSVLKGLLVGNDLHLTKEKSPYKIEGHCLVDEDSVLLIEPGTQIEFTGDYYLKINGKIQALGTADDEIVFIGSAGNNYGKVMISGTAASLTTGDEDDQYNKAFIDGNIFRNCVFQNLNNSLNTEKAVYIDNATFIGNRPEISGSSFVTGSRFESGLTASGGIITKSNISGLDISSGKVINNVITGNITCKENIKFENNTVENSNMTTYAGCYRYNNFNDVIIRFYEWGYASTIVCNNFSSSNEYIVSSFAMSYAKWTDIDMKHNYWGSINTSELNVSGNKANISFIQDYYDDFDKSRIKYQNWETEKIENCGYLGDSYSRTLHEPVNVGDIIMSDGSYLTVSEYQSYNGTATAVAVCAGTNVYGQPIGLGLRQSSSYLQWAPSGTTGYNTDFIGIKAYYQYGGDMDGSDNWEYVCSVDPEGTASPAENYPAFNYVLTYGSAAGLSGEYAEGWYMPSAYELYQLYENRYVLNESLSSVGGDSLSDWYWSSSQYCGSNYAAWHVNFNGGSVNGSTKSYSGYVCVVRAF